MSGLRCVLSVIFFLLGLMVFTASAIIATVLGVRGELSPAWLVGSFIYVSWCWTQALYLFTRPDSIRGPQS